MVCLSKNMMVSKLAFSVGVNYFNPWCCIINTLLCFLALSKHSCLNLLNFVLHNISGHKKHKFHVSFPQCHVAALSSSSSKQRQGFLPVNREGLLHQLGYCLHFIFPLMYNPIHCWDIFSAFVKVWTLSLVVACYFWICCLSNITRESYLEYVW